MAAGDHVFAVDDDRGHRANPLAAPVIFLAAHFFGKTITGEDGGCGFTVQPGSIDRVKQDLFNRIRAELNKKPSNP